ncbi:MAG TPA: hypothetical protein PLP34_00555 [Chitinophagaceae bacterium]|nr:hypothetical protein [Chitinophagaceae bacterium]HNF70870.1 hypothetical protein [Chitinophagaceae bacterium]
MKKFLPLLAFVILVLMSSCTQEYICQCKISYSGNPPGLPESQVVEFKIRDKKKEAAKLCEDNSTVVTKDGITMDEKCQLY